MSRDLTLEKYSELMLALIGKYRIITVGDYLTMPPSGNIAVICHEVRKSPEKAARMALVEKRVGLRTTYYFGWDPGLIYWAGAGDQRFGNFPELQVMEAKLYGHEAGYLPSGDGDHAAKLKMLRMLAPVRTSADQVDDDDLIGGPFSEDFNDFLRIDNHGKNWTASGKRLKGTDAVMELLRSGEHSSVILKVEPERWK